jgi:hypothetical protein
MRHEGLVLRVPANDLFVGTSSMWQLCQSNPGAVSLRSIENLDQGQKSEGTRRHSRSR